MHFFNINISISYWKFIILGIILLLIIGFVAWLVCSYYTFKWLKKNIDMDVYYLNEYNAGSRKILEKYGDYPIKRMYLVRQPITRFTKTLLNIITLYKFEREMKKYIETNESFFPFHTSIIIEVGLPNNNKKKIMIEKNNCIKLSLDFRIANNQDMRNISIRKKKYSLNTLLGQTQKRIGSNVFFNWHISRNNCQNLVKEVLVTLNKFEKNKKFILQSEIFNHLKFSSFSLHFIHTIINLVNAIESIIGKAVFF